MTYSSTSGFSPYVELLRFVYKGSNSHQVLEAIERGELTWLADQE